jgi:hypothetical protein
MASIVITKSGILSPYGTGELQLEGKVLMTTSLIRVTDNLNTASPLRLSTVGVTSYGAGNISSNTAYGTSAFLSNVTGIENTAIGSSALSTSTGSYNTALGHDTLSVSTASNNTAIGHHSQRLNTTGNGNTSLGRQSLSANLTGTGNTALGYLALVLNTNSNKLLNHINFYIMLMTSLSFTYLFNLCYSYNYSYFKHYTINVYMPTLFIIIFFII